MKERASVEYIFVKKAIQSTDAISTYEYVMLLTLKSYIRYTGFVIRKAKCVQNVLQFSRFMLKNLIVYSR